MSRRTELLEATMFSLLTLFYVCTAQDLFVFTLSLEIR